jgi:hypothetical protein
VQSLCRFVRRTAGKKGGEDTGICASEGVLLCFRPLARLNPGVCYDTAGGTEDEAEHVPRILDYIFLRGRQGGRMSGRARAGEFKAYLLRMVVRVI